MAIGVLAAGCKNVDDVGGESASAQIDVEKDFVPKWHFAPGSERRSNVASLTNARWLALASELAYADPQEHKKLSSALAQLNERFAGALEVQDYHFFSFRGKWSKAWGLVTDREYDSQAVYIEFPDYAVLAFRGTEQNEFDRWTDLDFFTEAVTKDRELDGKIHRGFYNAFRLVWDGLGKQGDPGVGEFLAKKRHDGVFATKKLYITGHSLGAALATLATWEALRPSDQNPPDQREPIPVEALYTFGSPRVGTETFANDLALAAQKPLPSSGAGPRTYIYRIVNYGDVVTAVPHLNRSHIELPGEGEENPMFLFLSKVCGRHYRGTSSGEHDFFSRLEAYWKTVVMGKLHYHLMNFYMEKLAALDDSSICDKIAARDKAEEAGEEPAASPTEEPLSTDVPDAPPATVTKRCEGGFSTENEPSVPACKN